MPHKKKKEPTKLQTYTLHLLTAHRKLDHLMKENRSSQNLLPSMNGKITVKIALHAQSPTHVHKHIHTSIHILPKMQDRDQYKYLIINKTWILFTIDTQAIRFLSPVPAPDPSTTDATQGFLHATRALSNFLRKAKLIDKPP